MSPDLTRTARGAAAARRGNATASTRMVVLAAAVVMITTAACGGGGDDSDGRDPTSAPTTSAVVTSTTPPTTTPETTAPSTDPPVTDPPPTDAPPTTLDAAALEQQIRADFERTWSAYFECVYEPAACQFAAINVVGGPLDDALRQTVDELITNNLRAARDSGPIGLRIESVTVLSSTRADLQACLTDGAVLLDIQDPANPSDDIVMNDALNSYRNVYRMQLVDGRWVRSSGEQIQVFAGVPACEG
jgi:hypothetical protein